MRPWKHFGARLSERLWPTAPTGRRSASAGNSLSISKPITTGAGSTALWGTNHLWNSKQQTTKVERTDSTKCVHKKGGREVRLARDMTWRTCKTHVEEMIQIFFGGFYNRLIARFLELSQGE